jgi:hypothetical protein
VFDYPSPEALIEYLSGQMFPDEPDGVPSVLAEIDRLDAAIADAGADPAELAAIARRLQDLAARWQPAPDGAAPDVEDLETATDDQLFDLIDKEFGVS